jgi:hypothetical protein
LVGDDRKSDENSFIFVTFDDLALNGELYDGKNVAVVGFYVIKSPDSAIYREMENGKNYHGKMIWIGNSRSGSDKSVVRKNATWSLVIGRYVNEKIGIFGKYFGSIDNIFIMYPVDINGSR